MNCYQTIRQVLARIYETLPGTPAERDEQINQAIDALTAAYNDLAGNGGIDHSTSANRFAYLFKYAGSRAGCVYTILSRIFQQHFARQQLKIASIGCGPGSDLMGAIKLWAETQNRTALQFELVDYNARWNETLDIVTNVISRDLAPTPFPALRFFAADITRPLEQDVRNALVGSDVFIISYLLSELRGAGMMQTALENVFSIGGPGTCYVIIDNRNIEGVQTAFQEVSTRHNLQTVQGERVLNLPLDEQVADLGEYLTRFGDYTRGRRPHIRLDSEIMFAQRQ